MKHSLSILLICLASTMIVPAQTPVPDARHVTVAREDDIFCGWPANHGPMHAWGDELLVAFTSATYLQKGAMAHAYDDKKPQHVWLARSTDGGTTWRVEKPEPLRGHKDIKAAPVGEAQGDIASDNPDFILLCGYEDDDRGQSWFQTSRDRGRSWGPRQLLADTGTGGYLGRTDYVLSGSNDALFLMTVPSAHKEKEGRVAALWTEDGGKTWTRRAWVGPDPASGFSIQPQTVKLGDHQRLLTVTRLQEQQPKARTGLQFHRTDDAGRTWRTLDVFIETGARSTAAALSRLRDGRLAVAYAQRMKGQICARLSTDEGATWSDELIVRGEAGNWDIGYPRLAQRSDGQLVTTYYWNSDPARTRTIEATIWTPPAK